ncbi:MAG: RimK family alpha-L-glutamate ligase [Bdellovibrionaceae bacterium]|nr:RimK family alpha-L-glutamate ligase [Pseudobdellovibrionaceae bacterium]
MNYLILSRLNESYSTRRLVQEIQARNHHPLVESPEGFTLHTMVDLVIPRLGSFRYHESMKELRAFSEKFPQIPILNSPKAFHQARHKKMALEILKGLPQPKIYRTAPDFPVVIKDCLASQGQGVFLCHTQAELELCLSKLPDRNLLFQEFIQECSGHDVRAFVVGAKVVGAIERFSADPKQEFRSNLSLGGHARNTQLTDQEKQFVLSAVQRLELDYAGVDFLRSKRGALLLEVNPSPGFEGLEKCTGLNIAGEIISHSEVLFQNSQKNIFFES